LNVHTRVHEIHARVERESAMNGSSPFGAPGTPDIDLMTIRGAYGRLYELRNLVGQMPPQPPTLRARIGAQFVRMVQRMLFWYTPQILRFHNETALVLGELCRTVEKQANLIGEVRKQMKGLRRELEFETLRGSQPVGEIAARPAAFDFSLQDHFRGPEEDTAGKLRQWLAMIEGLDPAGHSLNGPWLDVGCGRGEWISLACERGYDITGIDSSPISVNHCQAKNLRVSRAEAHHHLLGIDDGSLTVVTAFQVVEHLTMDALSSFVALSAQKLRPGGLLVVETPDPANLLMASHYFWNDPTHQRPIPLALMEFIFQYFGFTVVKRVRLNPFPPEEQMAYAEIEPVRRINELLYGPRDYGLIGRREQ